jgi:hypothetical protein
VGDKQDQRTVKQIEQKETFRPRDVTISAHNWQSQSWLIARILHGGAAL